MSSSSETSNERCHSGPMSPTKEQPVITVTDMEKREDSTRTLTPPDGRQTGQKSDEAVADPVSNPVPGIHSPVKSPPAKTPYKALYEEEDPQRPNSDDPAASAQEEIPWWASRLLENNRRLSQEIAQMKEEVKADIRIGFQATQKVIADLHARESLLIAKRQADMYKIVLQHIKSIERTVGTAVLQIASGQVNLGNQVNRLHRSFDSIRPAVVEAATKPGLVNPHYRRDSSLNKLIQDLNNAADAADAAALAVANPAKRKTSSSSSTASGNTDAPSAKRACPASASVTVVTPTQSMPPSGKDGQAKARSQQAEASIGGVEDRAAVGKGTGPLPEQAEGSSINKAQDSK